MMQDYLQNWKQRTKIGLFCSILEDTTSGVSQGLFSPLQFNILSDFFVEDK